jgi:hypothetical protein
MTGNQYANLGFEACYALGKKTNQIWMVERLVGNMNDFIYSGYQLIRNSKESYLIFITPDIDEYISNKKIEYLFNMSSVFKKKIITFSVNIAEKDINANIIKTSGGQIIECINYPNPNIIADGIIDLHCGGEKWRNNKNE